MTEVLLGVIGAITTVHNLIFIIKVFILFVVLVCLAHSISQGDTLGPL